jgi:hypothetical protein
MTYYNPNNATRNIKRILVGKPDREGLIEKLRIDGRIILKYF